MIQQQATSEQAPAVPTTDPKTTRGKDLPADFLMNYSHEILIKSLEGYGNRLNQTHKWALKNILSTYTKMAYGYSSGWVAADLGTGLGKTQSIIAWVTALNDLGYEDVSLTVCSSQVEALCDLKRALISKGVPEAKIGLWHTYPHDPDKAKEYLDKKKSDLKGFASLPSTGGHQSKQILLVTHNRVRGKGKTEAYSTYNGMPRDLLIWDESLFISESVAIEEWELESSADGLKRVPGDNKKPLRDFLIKCLIIFQQEKGSQLAGNEPKLLYMPSLDDDDIAALKEAAPSGLWREEVIAFLDICQCPLRIYMGQQSCLIRYTLVIDSGLTNIVILDASHNIRKVCHENKRVSRLWMFKGKPIASYEDVTIHQLFRNSGRTSVERYTAELGKTDSGVLKEVVTLIKLTPREEAILIFTFKQHPKGHDHIKTLRRSLEKNGIHPDEMITVMENGELVQRRRINFLTWGNECSLNRFSYCSNVILAGILHRSRAELAGKIVGERNDPTTCLSPEKVDEIHTSELCHLIYQALSRGSCRIVENGKARRMNAWLIHGSTDIRETIDEAMPGVKWAEWVPAHPDQTVKLTKPDRLADKVIRYLEILSPDIKRVSTKQIKKALQLKDASSTFKRALEIVEKKTGWSKDGKSLVRYFA